VGPPPGRRGGNPDPLAGLCGGGGG